MKHTKEYRAVESAFDRIAGSSLFRLNGERIDLCECIVALIDAVKAYPDDDSESLWSIGEFGDCCLSDFIAGAYWAYSDCHDGHGTYATLCRLGEVFTPNCASYDPDCFGERNAYEAVCAHLIPGWKPEDDEDEELSPPDACRAIGCEATARAMEEFNRDL